MQESYEHWLELNAANVKPQGIWLSVGAPVAEFGWKVHLTSTQVCALQLLSAAVPLLRATHTPFKVARDSDILGMLNEGAFGATQVGKFLTAYPGTDEECRSIAEQLGAETAGLVGPKIVTDLHIGGVTYVRYGSFNPQLVRDRLGNISFNDPQGRGGYKVPFAPPEGLPNPFQAYESRNLCKQSRRIIGPGYLLIATLSVHSKGSVYIALDVRDQASVSKVVLKEGRRHCLSDRWGRDMWDRLAHQEWLHRRLADRAPVPSSDSIFEDDDKLYLPLRYIEGRTLAETPAVSFGELSRDDQVKRVTDLASVATAVGALHNLSIIHRDITPSNIRIAMDGVAWLIDLELAYDCSSPTRPFTHGTAGFVSPQQHAGDTPLPSDDVFSLGSLIISSITGLDPHRVLFGRAKIRAKQLQDLSGAPKALCELAARCVAEDSSLRPSCEELHGELSSAAVRLQGLTTMAVHVSRLNFDEMTNLAAAALRWIIISAPRDEIHGMWVSPEIEATGHDATLKSPHAYKLYRSSSRGVAGVLYTIARLKRAGFSEASVPACVESSVDWLLSHVGTPDDQMAGLHFGEAGVAVAIAESIAAGLIENGDWVEPYLTEALTGPIDWPDLTHGASGQCVAALTCSRVLGMPQLALYADRCIEYLLDEQESDGSWILPRGVKGMEGQTYTGFAHGVAGIAYALANYARLKSTATLADRAAAAAERGARWLIDVSISTESVQSWTMWKGGQESWKWWCHGGPGIALTFLEMLRLTGNGTYGDIARRALRAHPFAIRTGNLSQCHGLSGLGEILLEAHAILGEREWMDRARHVGAVLCALARCEAGGASWLVENPFQPTADLMIGVGGVALFFARLAGRTPESCGIPLTAER